MWHASYNFFLCTSICMSEFNNDGKRISHGLFLKLYKQWHPGTGWMHGFRTGQTYCGMNCPTLTEQVQIYLTYLPNLLTGLVSRFS